MADSDSEAFESADEEIEDKKQKKVSHDIKDKSEVKKDAALPKPEPAKLPKAEPAKLPKTEPVQQPKPEPTQPEAESMQPPKADQSQPGETQQKAETPSSSWRSWGAFNVISNASKTVASITTQVSQSIIDAVNIPDPEEMAKMQAEERKKSQQSEDGSANEGKTSDNDSMFKLDSLLSGVSQISSKVVSGGLDTLEGIGKKTINILQDTDPNIKSKIRNMNVGNQPNLSDLLREAKDRGDEVTSTAYEKSLKAVSFEHLLDEYKGLVFLEALEILSEQSKMRIEQLIKPLSGKVLTEMEETLAEVKELCELDTENFDESLTAENLESKLISATEDLNVKLNLNEIVSCSRETHDWLEDLESSTPPSSIYEKSIHVMAKSCALSLNNLQKLAELLLSQDHRSTANESDSLTQLATIYCSLFNYFAIKFTEKITAGNASDECKKLATNVFLESSNAISHIKQAFNLFIPILQIGAV